MKTPMRIVNIAYDDIYYCPREPKVESLRSLKLTQRTKRTSVAMLVASYLYSRHSEVQEATLSGPVATTAAGATRVRGCFLSTTALFGLDERTK